MVNDDKLIRQVQDEVALVGRTFESETEGLELEGEIVTKRAIQPEMRLSRAKEEVDQDTEEREDRGLLAALLFGKAAGCGLDRPDQVIPTPLSPCHSGQPLDSRSESGQQHLATLVQGGEPKVAAARDEGNRRIDEAHVPAGVAAGVLVARGEEHALTAVERIDDGFDRVGDWQVFDETMDGNAAAAAVAIGTRH